MRIAATITAIVSVLAFAVALAGFPTMIVLNLIVRHIRARERARVAAEISAAFDAIEADRAAGAR